MGAEGNNAGAVAFGGPQAAPAHFQVGAVGFGANWQDDEPSLREMYEQACRTIVRLECEADELRAEVALLREEQKILAKGHQGRAKAAVTEGGTGGYPSAERPEPSPQINETQQALYMAAQRARIQAGAYKLEDLRDNSRWSIFNEGRAQALEKFAEELEGRP